MKDHQKYGIEVGQVYVRADGSAGSVVVVDITSREDQGDVLIRDIDLPTKQDYWIDCFKLAMVRYELVI